LRVWNRRAIRDPLGLAGRRKAEHFRQCHDGACGHAAATVRTIAAIVKGFGGTAKNAWSATLGCPEMAMTGTALPMSRRASSTSAPDNPGMAMSTIKTSGRNVETAARAAALRVGHRHCVAERRLRAACRRAVPNPNEWSSTGRQGSKEQQAKYRRRNRSSHSARPVARECRAGLEHAQPKSALALENLTPLRVGTPSSQRDPNQLAVSRGGMLPNTGSHRVRPASGGEGVKR
jgi:hypothetical protein